MGIVEQMHNKWRQQGRNEGRRIALERVVSKCLASGELSMKEVARIMEVPLSVVRKIKKEMDAK